MIINYFLKSILKTKRLVTLQNIYFSQKQQQKKDLKTYLQIIPPHQIYQIVQKKQKTTAQLIAKLKTFKPQQQLTVDVSKSIQKHLLKNIKYLKVHQLKDLIQLSSNNKNTNNKILHSMYKKIILNLTTKVQAYPLEDLINIVYCLAKYNKKQPQLLRQLQIRIIDQKIKIEFQLIRKILFIFTHLNAGSATLYSRITRAIKLTQHQFDPINLAEFAYYLSKVQQNAKGGFGIFKIAEQHLHGVLRAQKFPQLVNIAHYMIMQNLGSNKFQLELQQFIFQKFPTSELNINQLTKLLKSTSGYYFKFKDGALLQKLENQTIKYLKYCSVQQLQDILWSWGRCSRGNPELWEQLQKSFIKKIGLLKVRQLTFAYYSFCRSPGSKNIQVIKKMQQQFGKLDWQKIDLHYYIKFLLGMHKKKIYNIQLFLKITQNLITKMNKLTNTEFVNFLSIINQSDLHYQSQNIEQLKNMLKSNQQRLIQLLDYYRISQITEILFLWVKFNMNNQNFTQILIKYFVDINQIPKKSFIKALFCFVIKDKHQLFLPMLPILYQLRNYGPIAYFFPPYQLPLLTYSIYHIAVNGRTTKNKRLDIQKWLLDELKEYFLELQSRTLNEFLYKVYKQSQNLIKKYEGEKL